MPVSITCPACQATLRLDEKYLGKKIQCAGCKNVFTATVNKPVEEPLAAEIVEEPLKAEIVDEPVPDPATAIQTGTSPVALPKAVPPPLAESPARPPAKTRPVRRPDRKNAPAGSSALYIVVLLLGIGAVGVALVGCLGGVFWLFLGVRAGPAIAQNEDRVIRADIAQQQKIIDPRVENPDRLPIGPKDDKDPFDPGIKDPEPIIVAPDAPVVAQFPPHTPAALALKPCKLEAEKVTRMLPSAIDDVAVAGGGRFILFNVPLLRKIGMFDVNEGKVVHYFPTAGDEVKFTAGLTKLVVAYPDTRVIQRWDLISKAKELTVPLPDIGAPRLVLMGSASQGPVLLVGGKDDFRGGSQKFLNVATFKETILANEGGGFGGRGLHPVYTRVAANGTVFATWDSGSPQGLQSFIIVGSRLKSHYEHKSMGHITPGPDGKVLYTASGRFTAQCQPLGGAGEGRDDYVIPAAQGDFYLTVQMADRFGGGGKKKKNTNNLTLHLGNDPRPLLSVDDVIQTRPNDPLGGINRWDREQFGNDKRFIFIPDAELLVVVPFTNDRLELHRVNIDESLEKSGINYLFVVSRAPDAVQRGGTYQYKLAVKAKQGGVKYKLDAGPPGMTVGADGNVVWKVPANYDLLEETVLLTVSDAAGQEVFHSFKVRVVAEPLP